MKRLAPYFILCLIFVSAAGLYFSYHDSQSNGAPPYGEPKEAAPSFFPLATPWKRPEGPPKVGLQAGHWKNNELPEELSRLVGSTGASGGGKSEAQVNLAIAEETRKLLEAEGVKVDIIPATVQPNYWADVFVSIHADGSEDRSKSGYKFGAPWRDYTGYSDELVGHLERSYESATNLERDPNVTRNMRGYYAFAWWRYDHSIDPMTTAVIAETGFLTNSSDQKLLINQTDVVAGGLADGILAYLREREILTTK